MLLKDELGEKVLKEVKADRRKLSRMVVWKTIKQVRKHVYWAFEVPYNISHNVKMWFDVEYITWEKSLHPQKKQKLIEEWRYEQLVFGRTILDEMKDIKRIFWIDIKDPRNVDIYISKVIMDMREFDKYFESSDIEITSDADMRIIRNAYLFNEYKLRDKVKKYLNKKSYYDSFYSWNERMWVNILAFRQEELWLLNRNVKDIIFLVLEAKEKNLLRIRQIRKFNTLNKIHVLEYLMYYKELGEYKE